MTIEKAHLDLINRAVDGDLDAAESAELERILETSAEARKLRQDLAAMESVLRSIPAVQPPAALNALLLQALPAKSRATSGKRWRWLHDLQPGTGLRYALAAAAGALVVAIVFTGPDSINQSADPSALVGTMIPKSARDPVDVISTYDFHSSASSSRVQLQRFDDSILLDVSIDAALPLDVSIGLADTGLEPDALAQFNSDIESIAMSGSEIRLRANGKQQLSILLRRAGSAVPADPADIALEFSSEGQVLEQGSLPAAW